MMILIVVILCILLLAVGTRCTPKREGAAHHVAFVDADSPASSSLQTVEGNTPENVGDQADGDGVFAKQRPRSLVYAFAVAG